MISCFVCGEDASTGWIQGFAPAPDSHKMALCSMHDTENNRSLVLRAWNKKIASMIEQSLLANRSKAKPTIFTASIRFVAGGLTSLVCTFCEATPQNMLHLISLSEEQIYIPMMQIRDFSIRPYISEREADQMPTGLAAPSVETFPEKRPVAITKHIAKEDLLQLFNSNNTTAENDK